jgi:oxalate decarboxylase
MADKDEKLVAVENQSRRSFLGASSAALAAAALVGLTANAQQREDTSEAEADHSSSDPAQENKLLLAENPKPLAQSGGGGPDVQSSKPGGMRELYWHPNASEWQFHIAGKARMTVFMPVGNARTMDYNALVQNQ